ncbi:MAG: exodeoxyribonuclease large subunit, partial [Actinomycetota bacterium]
MSEELFDEDFDDDLDDEDFDDEDSDGVTFSVSEVAATVNDVLGEAFDRGIWVWGEITGLSVKGGHTYFTLVEATKSGGKAQLSVNLWAGVMTKLRPVLKRSGVTLENGVKVRVFGSLD